MATPQVRAVIRALERVAERAIVKITLDVTANLVETTPVDVGWARANWVPAIGTPVLKNLSGVEPTSGATSAAASEQQGALGGIVAGYKLNRGKVFVSNNVPYITKLNDGSSTQAPAGFVQAAIRKAVTGDFRGFTG